MKVFWLTLNLLLLLGMGIAGLILVRSYRSYSANQPEKTGNVQTIDLRAEPVHLESSLQFVKTSPSPLQGEAVLVPPGETARFTLRTEIDLKSDCDEWIRSYVAAHPNLEEEVRIAWQSDAGGDLKSFGDGRYEFDPPEAGGAVTLKFRGVLDRGTLESHPFTLSGQTEVRFLFATPVELIPKEMLDEIGAFPRVGDQSVLAAYREYYLPPTHLYRVDADNQDWRISMNFALGDFDLHFDYLPPDAPRRNQLPQFIALNPDLVLKLERILQGVREQGFPASTLSILAGFRSPAFNQWKKDQPGQGGAYTSGFSRHLYGCAADFYVDLDGDGRMDDMNKDGAIDMGDAEWIRDHVVDAVDCRAVEETPGLKGACGVYPEHDIPDGPVQTPNLHVDIRGWEGGPDLTRWDIDSNNKRRTIWSHWDKHPCPSADAIQQASQ